MATTNLVSTTTFLILINVHHRIHLLHPTMAANPESHISKGALGVIFSANGDTNQAFPQPVLQCLQIRPLSNAQQQNGPERYRVVFSDVNNYVQSMLATRQWSSSS